jgi:myo-inositol-1(or 4)-monophosphatase
MQPITNSLITASRKAIKFLPRDFFELELLQSNVRSNEEFCLKSYGKIKNILKEELAKHSKYLLFSDEIFELPSEASTILLINPLDAIGNLTRALPFFGVTITYLKRINNVFVPLYCVINLPMINEIYYAEKGFGVWVDKMAQIPSNGLRRLRVSSYSNTDKAIAISNSLDYKNNRSFGSVCYEITLFVSGKVDVVSFLALGKTMKPAIELMVREAGGVIIEHNDNCTVTNQHLSERLKS